MGVDLGWLYFRQQAAKSAAQAAAMASAIVAGTLSSGSPVCGSNNVLCQSATRCPVVIPNPAVTNIDVACQYASDNGFAYTSGGVQNVMVAAGTGTPPNQSGLSISYWVQVTTAETIPQSFSAVFGSQFGTVSARATAGYQASTNGCVYVLGLTGTTMELTNSAGLSFGCGLYVNSSSSASVLGIGNPSVSVTSGGINMAGGTLGDITYTPTPTKINTSVSDPFSNLTAPVASSCAPITGVTIGAGTSTLAPCVANGIVNVTSAINVFGAGVLNLSPGIYILEQGLTSTGGIIAGTGVMLFSQTGAINLNGGIVSLVAPLTGAYRGIAVYQPSSNTNTVTMTGAFGVSLAGAVYAPAANLVFAGGTNLSSLTATLVAKSIVFTGNAFIQLPALTPFSAPSGPVLLE